MTAAREALVLLLVAALPAGLAVAFHPGLADWHRAGLQADEVRASEVADWTAPVLWLDARDAAAFSRDHIPGAIHFDETAFTSSLGDVLAAWEPGRPIVVYCDSTACTRSRELAARLREAGLSDVYTLHGGWEAWSHTRAAR